MPDTNDPDLESIEQGALELAKLFNRLRAQDGDVMATAGNSAGMISAILEIVGDQLPPDRREELAQRLQGEVSDGAAEAPLGAQSNQPELTEADLRDSSAPCQMNA